MATAHMVTRSDWQQDLSMRFIIQIMWQSVWRSVLLWGLLQDSNVIRENSDPGDIIILLGGRTGRDGMRWSNRFFQGSHN